MIQEWEKVRTDWVTIRENQPSADGRGGGI